MVLTSRSPGHQKSWNQWQNSQAESHELGGMEHGARQVAREQIHAELHEA